MVYFLPRGKKHPKIILRDYIYEHEGKNKRTSREYWKCISYYETRCKARMITEGQTLKLNGEIHNHEPPPNASPFVARESKTMLNISWQNYHVR